MLAGPPAAVGATFERSTIAVGVCIAGVHTQGGKACRLRLGRTASWPDAVDSPQKLAGLAALAGVSLQRQHINILPAFQN